MNLDMLLLVGLLAVLLLVIHLGTTTIFALVKLADRAHPLAWLPLMAALLALPFMLARFGIGI